MPDSDCGTGVRLREEVLSEGFESDVGLAEYVDMLIAFARRVDNRLKTGEEGRFAGESRLGGLCIGRLVTEASSRSTSLDGDFLRFR